MHIQFKMFTLAALSTTAASTLIVYPPVTLIPHRHENCTSGVKAYGTRGKPLHPKSFEIPLGSCVDIPFFKSYTATKPKSDPDVFECSLYIYSGRGCTLDAFVSAGLNEVPPKCNHAAMPDTKTLGAKSALYTCEG